MYGVSGLLYIPEFITQMQEDWLLEQIDECEWSNAIARRTQHYGYRYDYRAKSVSKADYLGPLPRWADAVAKLIHTDGLMPALADQCIVNEYEAGQGIGSHIDCEPCFGGVVVSLSLGSLATMDFTRGEEKVSVRLDRRSLVVIRGDARYLWKHGISKRKTEMVSGKTVQRGRRVSLTLRTIVEDGLKG